MSNVAVKVHKLTPSWSEAKKSNYVKHATREFNIHKSLQHPRIVAFLEFFELDANSFATVLELCVGGDLDAHLKEHQVCTTALILLSRFVFQHLCLASFLIMKVKAFIQNGAIPRRWSAFLSPDLMCDRTLELGVV